MLRREAASASLACQTWRLVAGWQEISHPFPGSVPLALCLRPAPHQPTEYPNYQPIEVCQQKVRFFKQPEKETVGVAASERGGLTQKLVESVVYQRCVISLRSPRFRVDDAVRCTKQYIEGTDLGTTPVPRIPCGNRDRTLLFDYQPDLSLAVTKDKIFWQAMAGLPAIVSFKPANPANTFPAEHIVAVAAP